MSLLNSINTKLQAYKLIHDPTRLLILLYSKYGDIEEDLNYFYINQILYNRPSHYNSIFKEYQYLNFIDEFLKRFYNRKESISRIPKLNDYYKNYHLFFCRPTFRNYKISSLMHNYGDNKAEIFYKKNYATSNEEEEEKESSSESSLSSLDNITDNKNIFDKKTRLLIENNSFSNKITLTLDTSQNLNNNLISKRSKDDSFIKNISPLVNYQFLPKKKINNKIIDKATSNNNNKRNIINKNKIMYKKEFRRNNNIKNTLFSLVKNDLNLESGKKIFLSPKLKPYLSNYKSNLEELNKNKIKIEKLNGMEKSKNKTYNNNTNNNMNSNYKNFSKLSITLNNNLNNNINSMRNSNTSNNNTNKKNNLNNNKINSIQHSSIQSSGNNTIQKSKNKTFEIQNINSINNLTKMNSNSNFSNFNLQQNTVRNLKKSKYGSNFTLVKTPLNFIHSNLNSPHIISQKIFSKNNINHNNKIIHLNHHSSIPKQNFSKKEIDKNKSNNINKRKKNNMSLKNLIFSNQRSSSNTSKNKNKKNKISPINNFNTNKININQIYKSSRNKKNMITQTQTNLKSFRKDNIVYKTKSIDEEKIKLKNILFGINKNKKLSNYQMTQRIASQIEELIKKSKINLRHNNNFSNDKESKKSIIENSNISINNNYSGSNISCRGNNNKIINVNLNIRMNSDDRKDKIIKIRSTKK